MVVWPAKPSVTAPTPKALAALAAAMVRSLAEAQTELAAKIKNSKKLSVKTRAVPVHSLSLGGMWWAASCGQTATRARSSTRPWVPVSDK